MNLIQRNCNCNQRSFLLMAFDAARPIQNFRPIANIIQPMPFGHRRHVETYSIILYRKL
jgi:hypothetical protein